MRKGYVTLLTVLVIGAVSVAVTVSLLTSGVVSGLNTQTSLNMNKAKALADSCAEEALQQIRSSPVYSGSDSITQESDSCTYTVSSGVGQARSITVTATVSTVIRKISIEITAITPLIVVSSWNES